MEGCGLGDWGGVVLLGCELERLCEEVCCSVLVGVLLFFARTVVRLGQPGVAAQAAGGSGEAAPG